MAGEQAVAKQPMTSSVHPESLVPSEVRIFADQARRASPGIYPWGQRRLASLCRDRIILNMIKKSGPSFILELPLRV
ncbi:MAG TPA: hypothetical protein VMV40_04510, partial [Acidiferrobacter sp.]|nr:hypothetical protein [Acidiferrobacter sp.]